MASEHTGGAKHTPGPWTHLPGDSECAHPRVVARIVQDKPWSTCIADVGNAESVIDAGDEWEANAALIAAAPTMKTALQLCQRALALLTAVTHTPTNDPAFTVVNAWAQCVEAEANARAALAITAGETGTMNVAEKLTREIQRVTELKGQYESLRNMRGVNVSFALAHIGTSLEAAHKAQGSGDVGAMLAACIDLEGKA